MHQQFDAAIFSDVDKLVEDSLLEYKVELPKVLGNYEKLAETIRDVIALANTSRRRGETSYLIFGITDDPERGRQVVGIETQSIWETDPKDWKNISVEQQCEKIHRQFCIRLSEWINPPLEIEYRYGLVSCKREIKDNKAEILRSEVFDKLVSYLEIQPVSTARPFQVKKQLKDRNQVYLQRGDCWRRIGESKIQIDESEKELLYDYKTVPFIHNEDWRGYLQQFKDDYNLQTLTLFSSFDQELGQAVQEFVAEQPENVLVIEGEPGAGKTTFLKQVRGKFAELAEANLALDPFNHSPETIIPVYFSLNRYVEKGQLEHLLAVKGLTINNILNTQQRVFQPEAIFKDHTIRFLFLLDALDEIKPADDNWGETISAVSTLSARLAHCKIIITSRSNTIPQRWKREFLVFEIARLTIPQVEQQVALYLSQPDEALKFLKAHSEIFDLVRIPLMLQPIIDYWIDIERRKEELLKGELSDSATKISNESSEQIENSTILQDDTLEPQDKDLFFSLLPPIENDKEKSNLNRQEIYDEQAIINQPGDLIERDLTKPSVARLLEFVIGALLEHDEEKDLVYPYNLHRAHRQEQLSDFALYLDGKLDYATWRHAKEYLQQEIYNWSLVIGFLDQFSQSGIERVRFKFNVWKIFFASLRLQELVIEQDWNIINSLGKSDFWLECIEFFKDLTFYQEDYVRLQKCLLPDKTFRKQSKEVTNE